MVIGNVQGKARTGRAARTSGNPSPLEKGTLGKTLLFNLVYPICCNACNRNHRTDRVHLQRAMTDTMIATMDKKTGNQNRN